MPISSRRKFIQSILNLIAFSLTWLFGLGKRKLTAANHTYASSINLNNTDLSSFTPGYLKLFKSGELVRRADLLWERMESCDSFVNRALQQDIYTVDSFSLSIPRGTFGIFIMIDISH